MDKSSKDKSYFARKSAASVELFPDDISETTLATASEAHVLAKPHTTDRSLSLLMSDSVMDDLHGMTSTPTHTDLSRCKLNLYMHFISDRLIIIHFQHIDIPC